MTVAGVHARSHVPILALVQFSSAGFFEKKKIIAPVITVWERFSVAESRKCYNPPPIPTTRQLFLNWESCGQRIKGLSMWLNMRVCKGNFPVYEHKEALLLFLLVFLGCLSLPLLLSVSFTSSPISVSSRPENADGFLEPAYRPSLSGMCVSACVLGGNPSKKKGKLRSSIVQHV